MPYLRCVLHCRCILHWRVYYVVHRWHCKGRRGAVHCWRQTNAIHHRCAGATWLAAGAGDVFHHGSWCGAHCWCGAMYSTAQVRRQRILLVRARCTPRLVRVRRQRALLVLALCNPRQVQVHRTLLVLARSCPRQARAPRTLRERRDVFGDGRWCNIRLRWSWRDGLHEGRWCGMRHSWCWSDILDQRRLCGVHCVSRQSRGRHGNCRHGKCTGNDIRAMAPCQRRDTSDVESRN